MRTVLVASMRHHTRRYVAASLAVVIGVAFIVVIGMLTGATRSGLTADVGAPVQRRGPRRHRHAPRDAERLVDAAASAASPPWPSATPWSRSAATACSSRQSSTSRRSPSTPPCSGRPSRTAASRPRRARPWPTSTRQEQRRRDRRRRSRVGSRLRHATDVEVVGLVDSPVGHGRRALRAVADLRHFDDSLWIDAVAWGGTARHGGHARRRRDRRVRRRLGRRAPGRDLPQRRHPRDHGAALRRHRPLRRRAWSSPTPSPSSSPSGCATSRCCAASGSRGASCAARSALEALALGVVAPTIGVLAGALGWGRARRARPPLVRPTWAIAALDRPLGRRRLRRRRARHPGRGLAAHAYGDARRLRSPRCVPTPASTSVRAPDAGAWPLPRSPSPAGSR